MLATVEANKPDAQTGEQQQPGGEDDEPDGTADGHAKYPVTQGEHLKGIDECQDDIREDLAQHQFPGADGGDDELLDRAAFALTHHRGGGEDGGDGKEDHADDAGDHKVTADEVGVVPHLRAHFQRRGQAVNVDAGARKFFHH